MAQRFRPLFSRLLSTTGRCRWSSTSQPTAARSINALFRSNQSTLPVLSGQRSQPVVFVRRFCFASDEGGAVSFDIKTAEDFDDMVLKADLPVIVDFHADWCGPCKMLGPRLEAKVSEKDGAVLLAKVNVDDCADLAMDYGVQAVPTVMTFKNGAAVDQFKGMQDDQVLEDFIDRALDE